MLLLAASRMGLDPADCMMLGDSRNDAQAAANAGMPVMLMETGYNEGEPIAKWGPQNGFCDIFKSMDLAAKMFFLLTALTFSIQPNIFTQPCRRLPH